MCSALPFFIISQEEELCRIQIKWYRIQIEMKEKK